MNPFRVLPNVATRGITTAATQAKLAGAFTSMYILFLVFTYFRFRFVSKRIEDGKSKCRPLLQ